MTSLMPSNSSPRLILLVDDEPDLLEVLGIELEYAGFKTATARNGYEAIEMMKRIDPDAVLSDIRMPHGDGIFLLEHLMNERKGQPPLVFMSGFADLDEAAAFEKGAAGYLHKPIDIRLLVETLKRVTLTPRERWSLPVDASTCKTLRLNYPAYEKVKKEGKLRIGRGGFFAACDATAFDDGECIVFDIDLGKTDRLSGVGIVRWTRTGSRARGVSGCGVEILGMDDTSQEFVQNVLKADPERAFVPLF